MSPAVVAHRHTARRKEKPSCWVPVLAGAGSVAIHIAADTV